MTMTRLEVLDRSIEKTYVWLNDLAEELGTNDRRHAYRVLRAFLHALRDHLSVDETAQLAAQLPIFVRGVLYEGWDPCVTPERAHDVDSLLRRIYGEALLAGETEASVAAVAASREPRSQSPHLSRRDQEGAAYAPRAPAGATYPRRRLS